MPIFKRKKEVKKTIVSNVYMPQRKKTNKVVRERKNGHRRKNKFSRKGKTKTHLKNFIKILFYILIPVLIVGILYLAITFITNIRKGKTPDVITEDVIGLNEIPAYPGSYFMFKDDMENTSVTTFVSSGNSAYKIPSGVGIEDIYNFYKNELPKRGWESVISVPVASESMKSGEYWVKENTGLRIYTKFNDVWYESITKQDAQTGLASRVEKEIERELLLAENEAQDLLPDFPWILKVPREYVITYTTAPYENMRILQMKKMGTNEITSLTPIDKYNGGGLDYYLDKYIEYKNSDDEKCGIKRTTVTYTGYSSAIRGEISCNDGSHEVAVIVNSTKGVVYVLDSNSIGDLCFEETLQNLTPQDSTRY